MYIVQIALEIPLRQQIKKSQKGHMEDAAYFKVHLKTKAISAICMQPYSNFDDNFTGTYL